MATTSLNLARKWRSKNFEQIVGQDLSVKILRNSLYKGAFFPVYLFAGQRGCGKTSTARIFASALNCAKLSEFQKDPRSIDVPCLACESCVSMARGRHPDFFEIDAASHTGVDNVRQILDASTLMPLMGRYKVYLIDEAHMLSKASFNAFLKILEEPPESVLFILATTDPQKVIETVRSRCLQLYFKSVNTDVLLEHLRYICGQEGIRASVDGLNLIAYESQGSVRDAINMLEQVRFASSTISTDAVQKILGHCSKDVLVHVLMLAFCGKTQELLLYMENEKMYSFSHDHLWTSLVLFIRTMIWLKYGVPVDKLDQTTETLKKISRVCSVKALMDALHLFYSNESLVLHASSKYALLEMILLKIAQKNESSNDPGENLPTLATSSKPSVAQVDNSFDGDGLTSNDLSPWKSFLSMINVLENPLVQSVFNQATFLSYESGKKTVVIGFSDKLIFFNDWINDSKSVWITPLQKSFGAGVDLVVKFNDSIAYVAPNTFQTVTPKPTTAIEPQSAQKAATSQPQPRYQSRGFTVRKNAVISWESAFCLKKVGILDVVSDKEKWKLANTILEHFPGDVYEISERLS